MKRTSFYYRGNPNKRQQGVSVSGDLDSKMQGLADRLSQQQPPEILETPKTKRRKELEKFGATLSPSFIPAASRMRARVTRLRLRVAWLALLSPELDHGVRRDADQGDDWVGLARELSDGLNGQDHT